MWRYIKRDKKFLLSISGRANGCGGHTISKWDRSTKTGLCLVRIQPLPKNIHLANYIQVKLIYKLWPIIEVKFTCNLNPVILIRGCWVMGDGRSPTSVEGMVKPTTHKSQNNDDKSS